MCFLAWVEVLEKGAWICSAQVRASPILSHSLYFNKPCARSLCAPEQRWPKRLVGNNSDSLIMRGLLTLLPASHLPQLFHWVEIKDFYKSEFTLYILVLNSFSKAGAQLSFNLSFGLCFVLSSLGKPSTMHDFSRLCFLVFSFSVLHGNSCSRIYRTKMNFIYDNACPALQIPSGGIIKLAFLHC